MQARLKVAVYLAPTMRTDLLGRIRCPGLITPCAQRVLLMPCRSKVLSYTAHRATQLNLINNGEEKL